MDASLGQELDRIQDGMMAQLVENGFANEDSNLFPFFLFCAGKLDWNDMINRVAGNFERDMSAQRMRSNEESTCGGKSRYAENLYRKHIK